MKFYYVYKNLAHPENNDYIAPFTLEERLLHVETAKEKLGTEFTWICDAMDNRIKHALGDRPNSEFVIDPKGRIVRARSWSNPSELRRDLQQLVGKVDRVTEVKDLDLKTQKLGHQGEAASGVVPRLKLSGQMSTVKITPHATGGEPYYVKLHAEADSSLLKSGSGKLYIGFFMDPLYEVHWNNRVAPPHFDLTTNGGLAVVPKSGEGPKVEAESDVDPREFLIDVTGAGPGDSMELTLKYLACSSKWCKPFTQQYTIHLEQDSDGGRRKTNMGSQRKGNRSPSAANGSAESMRSRLLAADTNDDGKLSKNEMPDRMRSRFSMLDQNSDGFVDESELSELRNRMNSKRGPGPQRNR